MTTINDPSILRCTMKKSIDVTTKLILYISYIIVAITIGAIATFGTIAMWSIGSDAIYKWISITTSFVVNIPWYYYVGLVGLGSIPTYSFAWSWCVAREFTKEDWNSDVAFAGAVAVAGAFAVAFAVAVAGAGAVAGAFAVAGAVAVAVAFAGQHKSCLFVGAYIHYIRRNKK